MKLLTPVFITVFVTSFAIVEVVNIDNPEKIQPWRDCICTRTRGRPVGVDDTSLLRKRAEEGDVESQIKFGMLYHEGVGVQQDYMEAVKWYRPAAESGHAMAQTMLAELYYKGHGVPQDYTEAARWYRLAAEQGLAGAQGVLGSIYSEGNGVPQNHAEAVKWYRLAAEQGDPIALTNLGIMYATGEGVQPDYEEAYICLFLANKMGNPTVDDAINVLTKRMGFLRTFKATHKATLRQVALQKKLRFQAK